MIEKFKNYWKNKSFFAKLSDAIFIIILVAMLFPQGRLAIGGAVNRIKALISQPSIEDNGILIADEDYNWQLKDINNNTVNLKNSKGKVIFINLWATWCPPCIGEMPEIQKLYDEFKNENDIVFYLITDDTVDKMKKFVMNKGYTFPVFKSMSPTPVPFRVRSIPTTFVISKSGKIVIQKTGAANWGGEKMKKIIKELLDK